MLITIGRLPLPQFLINYLNPVYQIFLSPYLISHCNQLGSVKHGGCSEAILALKTVLTYFNNYESSVFICSLDAEKAFDRINHYNFRTVLINRDVPKNIVMLFYKWISSISFCLFWNNLINLIILCL